jgi:hypothetical protein
MSKIKRTPAARQKKQAPEGGLSKFNLDNLIPPKYHSFAAIGIIVAAFLIFFAPMYFGGKSFQSGDIVTSMSYTTFVTTYDSPLWNPLVFGGFPSAATVSSLRWYDFVATGYGMVQRIVMSVFSVDYAAYSFHLFILGLTAFFFMRNFKAGVWVSLMVSLATVFSTGIIVFMFIGHVSKLPALAMFPLIFLILVRFQNKISLLEAILLLIAIHLMVITLHVQIIFYILFAVLIYFIYYMIRSLLIKDKILSMQIIKSAGVFIVAAVIAVLMSFDEISQIYEYTPYSTRGSESITEITTGVSEESGSAFYDYHTSWSFSPGEILTFIVPSYYGFGNVTYKGPLTQNQEYELQTYFGQMPFVDVPMYMGVIIFFLALYGMYVRRKDPFVQFLTVLVFISLLISFGRNFPVLFDLMFYNFPFFNKFRVPSMILVLVQLSLPVLAGFGVMSILTLRETADLKGRKLIRNIAYIFLGLFILALLLSSPLKDWFISHMQGSGQKGERLIQMQLGDFISSMFITDLLFALGLTALVFGSAFLYISGRFSSHLLVLLLITFVLTDLWRINLRAANYIEVPVLEGAFDKPDYIAAIEARNDKEPFRLLNIKQDGTSGSLNQHQNYHAYFLMEDLFGYSGIKPRAYQDIIDIVGSPVNHTLWRMLNTKYIISDKSFYFESFKLIQTDGKTMLYEFTDALPRAYFVNSVIRMEGIKILNSIKDNSFDPAEVAFTDEDLKVDTPDETAYVNIASYGIESINLDVNASGNNFLFLGNTYYPVGWKAAINGEETRIYKANHGYMGIIVPPGSHKVEFYYHPDSYYLGKYIAMILSGITILILGFLIVGRIKEERVKTI